MLWLYTLSAASGLLQTAIFPNLEWYWLSWIALVPLLYALLIKPVKRSVEIITPGEQLSDGALTPKQGFFLGYFCGVIWYAGTCYWVYHVMNTYGGLSPVISAILLVLFCLYLGLYHGLFAALLVRAAQKGIGRAIFLAPFLWVAFVLFCNLLPVVLLRLTLKPTTEYSTLRTMDFVHDQHKFSDWVYLAASANMASRDGK